MGAPPTGMRAAFHFSSASSRELAMTVIGKNSRPPEKKYSSPFGAVALGAGVEFFRGCSMVKSILQINILHSFRFEDNRENDIGA